MNEKQPPAVSELVSALNEANNKVTHLENELLLRDKVVRDVFGFELKKMLPRGTNEVFIERSLSVLKCGVREKVTAAVSAMSCDALLGDREYYECAKSFPFYEDRKAADEQPEQTQKMAEISANHIKSFLCEQ